jgi:hypothetical protein
VIKIHKTLCKIGEYIERDLLLCRPCRKDQRYNFTSSECIKCSTGLNCDNPINVTAAKSHYIVKRENEKIDIYECSNSQSCIGENKCSDGYQGILCKSCIYNSTIDKFYVKSGDAKCIECEKSIAILFLYFFTIIILCLFTLFITKRKVDRHKLKKNVNFILILE